MGAGTRGGLETPSGGHQVVEGYGSGGFRVSGTTYSSSIIVFPERTLVWVASAFADVDTDALAPVLEAGDEIDILLLGCGARMQMVPPAVRDALRTQGIVVEPMDTGAAARTFNLLLSEGRRVAAALIAVT